KSGFKKLFFCHKRFCSITFDAGDPTKTATAKFTITEYRPPIGQPFDPAAIESFKQPDPEVFDAPCKIPDANLGREFTFIDPVDKKPVTVPPSHARKCSTPIPSVSEKYLSGEGRARVFKCGVEWTVGTEKHTAVSVPLKIANYVFPVVVVKLNTDLNESYRCSKEDILQMENQHTTEFK
ncbi:MAG TPA: hypothetical protein VJB06_04140, partial [archaeon]|nr:hypothetical protein [archaeon]